MSTPILPSETAAPPSGTSRRSLLAAGAAAGVAVAAVASTAGPSTAATVPASPVLRAQQLSTLDPLWHLLRRATYAPIPAELTAARELGATGWLETQLDPDRIDDRDCDALVAQLPLYNLSITGVRDRVAAGTLREHGWETMFQTAWATLTRAVYSRRQLLETTVEFWSNHLNVTCPAGEVWDSRGEYDRVVIRAFALGRFADMLKACARHPAMLNYLDNRSSTKAKPNENYARELLELHTVGLGYSEADVQNAARLLTGLGVDKNTGLYRFNPGEHAVGAVTVLGFTHPNATAAGGEAAAVALLEYLAMHPATARRIATKLCVRFVADAAPASLVDTLAKVYLANNTAIVPVLRALFTSAEFAASVAAKVRTPLEDAVATVRVLGYRPATPGFSAMQQLYWMVNATGQAPLAWAPPNGYPDVAVAWASPSGLLQRCNNHLSVTAGWHPHTFSGVAELRRTLAPVLPGTYGALIQQVAVRLFGCPMLAQHVQVIAGFFGKTAASALAATHPVVQGKFKYLVALLLDSPYFQVR